MRKKFSKSDYEDAGYRYLMTTLLTKICFRTPYGVLIVTLCVAGGIGDVAYTWILNQSLVDLTDEKVEKLIEGIHCE